MQSEFQDKKKDQYQKIEKLFVNYILKITGPSTEQDEERKKSFAEVKGNLIKALENDTEVNTEIFCFGSYPFKSYIVDSDIDLSLFLKDKTTNKISFPPREKLISIFDVIKKQLKEMNITEIDDLTQGVPVLLIKCKYEKISFDISINNYVGLSKLIFMNHMEKKYFPGLLYKRSLLLIKSWCNYEGCILGSNVSLLSSYALEILVIYMFNLYFDQIQNELNAFCLFFEKMNEVKWEEEILTIYGLFNINELKTVYNNNLEQMILAYEQKGINKCKMKYTEISEFCKTFNKYNGLDKEQTFCKDKLEIREHTLNIIEPIYNLNNLGRSLNFFNYNRITELFEYMKGECSVIKSKVSSVDAKISLLEYTNTLLSLFHQSLVNNNENLYEQTFSQPKIIILPNTNANNQSNSHITNSNLSGNNSQGQGGNNSSNSNNNSIDNLSNSNSINQDKIQNNLNNTGNNSINTGLSGVNEEKKEREKAEENAKKVQNMNWPYNQEVIDEQAILDYEKTKLSEINYLDKQLLDYFTESDGEIQDNEEVYNTEMGEVESVEKFIHETSV